MSIGSGAPPAIGTVALPDEASHAERAAAALRAWRKRGSFTPGTNLDAWLFTILRNQFYSDRRRCREVADVDGSHTGRLAAAPTQGDYLDLRDAQTALASLAPAMREALVLVTVGGVTYEEAAQVLGCRVGTVKSRVCRARTRMVEALGYQGNEIGRESIVRSVLSKAP